MINTDDCVHFVKSPIVWALSSTSVGAAHIVVLLYEMERVVIGCLFVCL